MLIALSKFLVMSFLVYCVMLILYLHESGARHIRIVDRELYDQKYHIFGTGLVRDHVESGKHQKSLYSYSVTTSLRKEEEDTQGNEITSSSLMVLQEAAKIKELKIHSRRILLQPKQYDAKETVDSKENDGQVAEDVVVMDYAQPHRKQPIHNKDP